MNKRAVLTLNISLIIVNLFTILGMYLEMQWIIDLNQYFLFVLNFITGASSLVLAIINLKIDGYYKRILLFLSIVTFLIPLGILCFFVLAAYMLSQPGGFWT